MKSNNRPIGIFDSGIGGLTVLKELQTQLPDESFIYIGDTAHLPYGNKSSQTIINCSQSICQYLLSQDVKLIIIACNTASSLALNFIKQTVNIPVIDVITPVHHLIMKNVQLRRVGIIGTYNTIQSNAYCKVLVNSNNKLKVFQQACPLFVPLIEEGLQNDLIAHLAIKKYLINLINNNIELLVLGCTHYPLMKKSIQENIPTSIQILDSAQATADYLTYYLTTHTLLSSKKINNNRIIITDKTENFKSLAKIILNNRRINLEILNITS